MFPREYITLFQSRALAFSGFSGARAAGGGARGRPPAALEPSVVPCLPAARWRPPAVLLAWSLFDSVFVPGTCSSLEESRLLVSNGDPAQLRRTA
jgi:hypothetical protein